ncbi:MAG TPA: TRAP transporter substrate-binding protein [Syntrophorhabdaceae bacterium]|nr:TRAP transporter substrate-binding protein [Syntrophorhabdaceae bacterium]
MKKLCFVLTVSATFLFLFMVLSMTSVSFAQDKIQIKISNWFPVGVAQDKLLKEWGEDLEKRTNGRVKVSYYPTGTLIPAPQSYDGVVKGIADVTQHVAGYTVGRFPMMELIDLPLGYPNSDVVIKLANDYYKKFQPKEMDHVKVLWFHAQAPGILHTKSKPVYKLEDLTGLKIRTFGSNAKLMSRLGGTPVAMPMGDVYDALSKGVADGLLASYETMENWKFADFIRYSTECYDVAYTALFMVVMNKNKWNSLPKDIKDIIDKMSEEYINKSIKMWNDIEQSGKKLLLSKGGKIITLSKEEQAKWVEKATPLFEEYANNVEKKGLPGKEAVKFIQNYVKKYKK